MKIIDFIWLDMRRLESKSYIATLKLFGYEEFCRTESFAPEITKKDFSKPIQNPNSVTMVLVE